MSIVKLPVFKVSYLGTDGSLKWLTFKGDLEQPQDAERARDEARRAIRASQAQAARGCRYFVSTQGQEPHWVEVSPSEVGDNLAHCGEVEATKITEWWPY